MAPLLLGHRGARAYRDIPENTLPSFELCLQHGCDGCEFDVRRSGDDQAVICHDPVSRGMHIDKTPASDLALPLLEPVLRQLSARAFLDIELKVAGLESQVLSELRRHPPQKGFVVSSFLPEVLVAIHALDPATPLGLLCETREQLHHWRQTSAQWLIPNSQLVDQELVVQARDGRKKVMVWTVNRAERMRELAAWGVDAIISDDTELLICTLR